MAVKSYRELIAWKKAMDLAETIYRETAGFPKEETYGLTSHTRKSALSIPSNIAEGQGRKSARDFARFLSIARGSLCELETQVILAARLGYLTGPKRSQILDQAAEVGRLTNGLLNSLRTT